MDVRVVREDAAAIDTGLLVVPCFAGEPRDGLFATLNARLGGALGELIDSGEFDGTLHRMVLCHTRGGLGAARVLLLGLGSRAALSLDGLRNAAAHAVHRATEVRAGALAFTLPGGTPLPGDTLALTQSTVEGALLAAYRFDAYRGRGEPAPAPPSAVVLLAGEQDDFAAAAEGARRGEAVARAAWRARDLCNHPPNVMTPVRLAEEATELSARSGMQVRVLEPADMAGLGMGGMLAVSRGSRNPGRFIVLEYDGRALGTPGQPLVLIGKAVTFDTGGVSIKAREDMHHMKADMTGGADVLAAMEAAARLQLPLHLVALVPAVENMPDGDAYRPGDIITMLDGTTVEIQNTDAEGRLILADALVYGSRLEPGLMVDIATLTGASAIALGQFAIGMFVDDDAARRALRAAGERSGERVWEMPLWPEYFEQLESYVADMRNIGGPSASMITAAVFLSRFTGGRPWAHLDIYSTCWSDRERPLIARGPTGSGARLLTQFLIDRGLAHPAG